MKFWLARRIERIARKAVEAEIQKAREKVFDYLVIVVQVRGRMAGKMDRHRRNCLNLRRVGAAKVELDLG